MIHQQDPVGLITFDEKIRDSLPPRSKRTQLGNVLSLAVAICKPSGTDGDCQEPDSGRRHAAASQPGDAVYRSAGRSRTVLQRLRRLRHGGHDVILFHILDEAEARFPFEGMIEFEEPETHEKLKVDAGGYKAVVSGRSRSLLRSLPARMPQERHRLCAARHEHAIRQGSDRIPGQPPGEVLSGWTCSSTLALLAGAGTGGRARSCCI